MALNSRTYLSCTVAATVLSAVGAGQVVLAHGPSLTDALTGGEPHLNVRLRYEDVDQDVPGLKNARAGSIRTRLGYRTADFNGFTLYAEYEGTSVIGGEAFNSTQNGNVDRAVVADPKGSELNQAYVSFTGWDGADLRYGRQRIILGNARFVGNVGWRQNEQTFDATTVSVAFAKHFSLYYGLVTNTNFILFNNVPQRSHLLNVNYQAPFGTFAAYGYALDFDQGLDSQTVGLRFSGAAELGQGFELTYAAEYAKQSDYKDANSNQVDGEYINLGLGASIRDFSVELGYELLGAGDADVAGDEFETPLATKHKFNGFADQFLNTPTGGLQDLHIKLGYKPEGWVFGLHYHVFSADEASENVGNADDYGKELNLLAVKKLNKHTSAGLKFADYSADDFGVDTQKIMVFVQFKF